MLRQHSSPFLLIENVRALAAPHDEVQGEANPNQWRVG
jgi:hypothetical protein